jgi:hypothetical protein
MNKYNILAIFSNHTYDNIKYNISFNNISYIIPHVNDIIIIDSIDEEYAVKLKTDLTNISKIKNFYFVKNDKIYLDFYKWNYIINISNTIIDKYDYILFINDSIIITHDMNEYFNYLNNSTNKINIYGYNDSTQLQYHYQSYLFMIHKNTIPKFKNLYEEKKPYIYDVNSLIRNLELNFYSIDENHDCYIKIGEQHNKNNNIFWENDKLYEKLLSNNVLCLIKLKRIQDYQKSYIYDYFNKVPINFNHSFYKENYYDLRLLSNKELENHYLKYGQFEGRKYTYNSITKILPTFYRKSLELINMLHFFDIDDNLDVFILKKKNNDNKNKKNRNIILNFIEKQYINKNTLLFYLNIMKKLKYFENIDNNYIINNFYYDDFIEKNKHLNELGIIGILNIYIKNNKLIDNDKQISDNDKDKDKDKQISDNDKDKQISDKDKDKQISDKDKNKDNDKKISDNNKDKNNNKDKDKDNDKQINDKVQKINYNIIDKININLNKDIYSDFKFDINTYIHLFDNLLNNELTHKFIDIIKYNKKINLPNDFDINVYKKLNSDLNHLNNDELLEHFKKKCINECRLYKLPDDFCPKKYKKLYNDISSYSNDKSLIHFINYGFKEGRLYKIPDNFDVEIYKKIYFENTNIDTQTVMHVFINSKNRNYNKLNII